MAFNYFLTGVAGLYVIYYISMMSIDVIKMNKEKRRTEGSSKEIDISGAVAGYKPKVATEVMKKESAELLSEMKNNNGDGSEDNDGDKGRGEELNPFEMDGMEMVGSTTDDEELKLVYDTEDDEKDQYPEMEINGGYSVGHLKDMLLEMRNDGNMFSHIEFPISVAG